MNISKKFYDELLVARETLNTVQREKDNIRKAYDEVNERSKLIINDLTRRLTNVEASNQQLSQMNARVNQVAQQLALDKDKMSNAMVNLLMRFEELIVKYHKAVGHPEKA